MLSPTYITKNLLLHAYRKEDENRFVETGTDEAVVRFMGGATGNETTERALFQRIFTVYAQQDTNRWFWIWGIYKEGRLCGHFELKETENTTANELEIVYMVHPKERGRGIMSEVLAFVKSKQKDWKRHLIATVDLGNEQSISLLKKWGITKKEWIADTTEAAGGYFKLWLADD